MNDIVGRLRRYAVELRISTLAEMEAADEIERLRAELAGAQQQAAAYRFIRAGNAYIEPYVTSSGPVPSYVVAHWGQHCDTPEEFDAVIFAAMENDNG